MKEWAKKHELVGTADGYLNSSLDSNPIQLDGHLYVHFRVAWDVIEAFERSTQGYAYMLLVVFFLQSVQPAVVPNLQMLATESFRVADRGLVARESLLNSQDGNSSSQFC